MARCYQGCSRSGRNGEQSHVYTLLHWNSGRWVGFDWCIFRGFYFGTTERYGELDAHSGKFKDTQILG